MPLLHLFTFYCWRCNRCVVCHTILLISMYVFSVFASVLPSPSNPFPPLFHVIYCKRLGLLRLGVSIHHHHHHHHHHNYNNNNNVAEREGGGCRRGEREGRYERGKERRGQRDRQTDRDRQTETDRLTWGDRDIYTDRETDRETERQRKRQRGKQTDRQTNYAFITRVGKSLPSHHDFALCVIIVWLTIIGQPSKPLSWPSGTS